jgi:AcrR family transcriptional regulator
MTQDMTQGAAQPSLRERKQDVTRQVILEAAAGIVIEQGVQGFSVQGVADRAGVSHRTVYRYFATRQELLDSLDERVEERRQELGLQLLPGSSEELPGFASAVFERYELLSSIFHAASMLELGGGVTSTNRTRRTEEVRRMVEAEFSHVPAEERRRFFAVLRHLISVHTWQILRTQYGLTGKESGPVVAQVVAWTLEHLVRWEREAALEEPAEEASGR